MPDESAPAASAAILAVAAGCSDSMPARVYPDKPDPQAGARALELYDADHDGCLNVAELDKVPGLKAAIKQVDTNGDGKISAAEITARIKTWEDSRAGRLSLACMFTHNGKPLAGATIKLVPEKFLGGELKTATGVTDSFGIARPATPGGVGPASGVSPGFYRVEVTKEGENIPAKYNTETKLGTEAALDCEGIGLGVIKFELNY